MSGSDRYGGYRFRNQRYDGRGPAADAAYLDQLAARLADPARLPLPLARRRVKALAISGRARESG